MQSVGEMILVLAPEIGLLVLALILLGVDLAVKKRAQILGWVTFAGLCVVIALSILFARPAEEGQLLWGGMLRLDGMGFIFRLIFLSGAAITALLAQQSERLSNHGEFFVLLLVSTLGMNLMASAADLIVLYLAIETTSIPLFVMAGFYTRDERSVEAGVKYLLYSAMASAIMLFGFSFLYGFSGTTQLYEIASGFQAANVPLVLLMTALLFVLVGFGFKVSAAPFHFWAPDVYEGAPTQVAGFLSTASKAAGFAVLIRLLTVAFPDQAHIWMMVLAVLATLSMVVGNLLALVQRNIKRLLAYSSIAQAGYMLIGVAAGSQLGNSAAVYYLMAYLVTNLAAFGVVMVAGRAVGSDQISAFAGLSRRSPALAFLMLGALLSLGGIPPFAGFMAKVLVLSAAVETGFVWLAWVGIINSIVGLYYYLNVAKVIYLYQSDQDDQPVNVKFAWGAALAITGAAILVLGVWVAPWLQGASMASIF